MLSLGTNLTLVAYPSEHDPQTHPTTPHRYTKKWEQYGAPPASLSRPPVDVPVDMRKVKEKLTTPSHSRSYGKHGYYGARITERHLLLILCEYKPIAMEPPPNSYHGSIAHHIVIFIIVKVILCF